MDSKDLILIEDLYGAHNYHPLDVVVSKAKGIWMWDVEGKKYLDFLAAYSAANQGHCHPRIIKALQAQAKHLTLTSRAFRNDQWPMLAKELCDWTGYEMVLPMNSGAEAVETAIKGARKWGYQVKGIPEDRAEIIACTNNFHGRTVTIVSFSTEPLYRSDYGPFHARLPHHPVRRRRRPGEGHHPEHGGFHRRTHPGRGRDPHPARRLPEEGQGDLRAEQRPPHRRRDPDGPRPRRQALRVRIRRRPARYGRHRQIPRRRRLSDLGRPGESRTYWAYSSPASTAPRSAAIRWPAPWPARPSGSPGRRSSWRGRRSWGPISWPSSKPSGASRSRRSAAGACSSASSSIPKPAAPAGIAKS